MPHADPTLNQLIEANTGFVHSLALRLAPAPGMAEDIAQQVFLEFIAKASQWDLTRDIKPLLAGMTRGPPRLAGKITQLSIRSPLFSLAFGTRPNVGGSDSTRRRPAKIHRTHIVR